MLQHDNRQPLVSFCMSTFKRPVFLQQQLATILKQTYQNFEIVICDNDPEASGAGVVQENGDARIHYHCNGSNLGMIQSFNRSIELSKGDYIVMITDDDPVYPNMLETLIDLTYKYPGYGMYLGGCDWFCTHHEVANLYQLKVGTNTQLCNDYDYGYTEAFEPNRFVKDVFSMRIFRHYLWSTGIVKRNVMLEIGGVPNYGTPFLGDYAFIAAMGAHSGCVMINQSLGCQTLHNENFGRNQNEQLITAAKNFSVYLESKMNGLKEWNVIKPMIDKFVGVWLVGHMAFLNKYSSNKDGSLKQAEREIFALDFMKQFKIKYYLKRHFPYLHDSLVSLRQQRKKPAAHL